MTPASRRAVVSVAVVALALAGCSGPKTEGQKKMSKLSDHMQRLEKALVASKADVQKTMQAHSMLVSNVDGDLSGNFGRFHDAMEDCDDRQQQIASLLDQISATSSEYFAGWESDLERIDNPDLRERSEERLEDVRSQLQSVQEQVGSMRTAFDPLMRTLRDHLLYLSNDLTVGAATSLSKDSGRLQDDAGTVYTALDQGTPPVRAVARALSTSPKG